MFMQKKERCLSIRNVLHQKHLKKNLPCCPLFAFLSVNSKNEKRTQRGLKKVVGVQGEEEKTFLKSFFFLPRQT